MKKILLIIPAYNEAENIGEVLEKLQKLEIMKEMDILVIDDFSQDNTAEIAREHGVRVVRQVFNMGYGAAIQSGYKYALEKGYEYVVQMDADGQHDVCNVEQLCEKMGCFQQDREDKADIVIGSRFLDGASSFPISVLKKYSILFFRRVIRKITGCSLTDPTSGLQCLNKKAFSFYAGYNQFDLKYPDLNMIVQMLLLGFKIEEIPAVMHERTAGVSMHSGLWKVGKYMILMMLSTWNAYSRYRRNAGGKA